MDEWINEWMDEYMNERMNELLATRYGPTIMSRSCHALQSQLQKSFCLVSEKNWYWRLMKDCGCDFSLVWRGSLQKNKIGACLSNIHNLYAGRAWIMKLFYSVEQTNLFNSRYALHCIILYYSVLYCTFFWISTYVKKKYRMVAKIIKKIPPQGYPPKYFGSWALPEWFIIADFFT